MKIRRNLRHLSVDVDLCGVVSATSWHGQRGWRANWLNSIGDVLAL